MTRRRHDLSSSRSQALDPRVDPLTNSLPVHISRPSHAGNASSSHPSLITSSSNSSSSNPVGGRFSFNVLHINICSLNNRKHALLESLLQTEFPCDILMLSEHHLKDFEISQVTFRDYNLAGFFCRNIHKGGGVAIFSHQKLQVITRPDLSYLSCEGVCEVVTIEVVLGRERTIVSVAYRPPARDPLPFLAYLSDILKTSLQEGKPAIIGGDFNVDWLLPSLLKSEIQNLLISYDYHASITIPTRITDTTSSCLDNFILNKTEYETRVLDCSLSDHCLIYIRIATSHVNPVQHIKQKFRNFKDPNSINNFKDHLLLESWADTLGSNETDVAYTLFDKKVQYYIQLSFPLKERKCCSIKRPSKIFNDPVAIRSRERMNMLRDFAQQRPELRPTLAQATREYCLLIQSLRRLSNDKQIDSATDATRESWKLVRRELGRDTSRRITQLRVGDRTVEDHSEMAEIFLRTFSDIPDRQSNSHTIPSSLQTLTNVPNTLFLYPIDPHEILQAISKLNNSDALSIDDIPTSIIKHGASSLSIPLTHILNLSFSQGKFPTSLKRSLIHPIFKKKGDQSDPSSYRPISLLSPIGKLLEIIMLNRLSCFIAPYISIFQHGFVKGKSTSTALYQLINSVTTSIDDRGMTLALLFDLSKAFDRVDHSLLLYKLERLGVRGVALDWFRSYLEGRSCRVGLDAPNGSCRSSEAILQEGVPQGSILGPMLFLIMINDLPNTLNSHGYFPILYADDLNVLITGSSLDVLLQKAAAIYKIVLKWVEENRLLLNNSKTNLLLFKSIKSPYKLSNNILLDSNLSLASVNCTKFLGLHVDEHLSWGNHISQLCNKLSSSCFALRKLKPIVSFSTLIRVYHALFVSHMSYGIVYWGSCSQLEDVFRKQKLAIRILFGLNSRESCRGVFRTYGLLTAPALFVLECISVFHRNPHLIQAPKTSHEYDTRNRHRFPVMPHRTTKFEKGPLYSCTTFYNLLPSSYHQFTLRRLRLSLKSWLVSLEPYSLRDIINNPPHQ